METITRTERLHVRKMTTDDHLSLARIFEDTDSMHYYAGKTPDASSWLDWTLENYRKYNIGMWVVEHEEDGRFLGQCGIVPHRIDGHVEVEMGYLFVKAEWGNGYASEAARACLRFALETLDVPRIVSLIDERHARSVNVATRAGMVKEKELLHRNRHVSLYAIHQN
ncbi:GNAT family N-acetyltransferase [Geomicrobium sp. JSM 1781026]|uniref:GNAT family N-acetyltransferase n=1 Tax=Geomicrobium sp. JSM 1781026 TaxID=3344580 RepID=UPI0035C17BD5